MTARRDSRRAATPRKKRKTEPTVDGLYNKLSAGHAPSATELARIERAQRRRAVDDAIDAAGINPKHLTKAERRQIEKAVARFHDTVKGAERTRATSALRRG